MVSRKIPSTRQVLFHLVCRENGPISPRWPIFPAGSFLGKIPTAYLRKNRPEKSVLAEIHQEKNSPPGSRQNLAWSKLSVVFPASFSPRKNHCIEIPAEKLHILLGETQILAKRIVNSDLQIWPKKQVLL